MGMVGGFLLMFDNFVDLFSQLQWSGKLNWCNLPPLSVYFEISSSPPWHPKRKISRSIAR